MTAVFRELNRILKRDGFVAFESGGRNAKLKLEDSSFRRPKKAGLKPTLVLVNQQEFTKTSNCWGVRNMSKGTNTNRVVLLPEKSTFSFDERCKHSSVFSRVARLEPKEFSGAGLSPQNSK